MTKKLAILVGALTGVAMAIATAAAVGEFAKNQQAPAPHRALKVANESTLATPRTRVHLLEVSKAYSPKSGHSVTSMLFMVEHLGNDAIVSTETGSLNFSDSDGNRIAIPVGNCRKSGTTNHSYEYFANDWHVELPQPEVTKRTNVIRHWMCDEVPCDAQSIEISFGRNGQPEEFKFYLSSL